MVLKQKLVNHFTHQHMLNLREEILEEESQVLLSVNISYILKDTQFIAYSGLGTSCNVVHS